MTVLEYYLRKQSDKNWVKSYQSISKDYFGKNFSYYTTNFRKILSFQTQFKAFKDVLGISRKEWRKNSDNGQEEDKQRVVNLLNASFVENDSYNSDIFILTEKGKIYDVLCSNKEMEQDELWILTFLLILDYSTKVSKLILIKEALDIHINITKHGILTLHLISLLKEVLTSTCRENLFDKDGFWLITFNKEHDFLELFVKSTEDEKKALFEYVKSCALNKNNKDCIAHKFVNSGVYSVNSFKEDVYIILFILIGFGVSTQNLDTFVELICRVSKYLGKKIDTSKILDIVDSNPIFNEIYNKVFLNNKYRRLFEMNCVEKNIEDIEVALGMKNSSAYTSNIELTFLSPEWFKSKETLYKSIDEEKDLLSNEFYQKWGPNAIKLLDKQDLSQKLFIGTNQDSLCYQLEYNNKLAKIFTGIGGGSSYKYPCFFNNKMHSWVTGSGRKNKILTNEEADEIADSLRNSLIKGYEIILDYKNTNSLISGDSYLELYKKLIDNIGNLADKSWVMKYFTIIFPDLFAPFYSGDWQNKVVDVLELQESENRYAQNGYIMEFVNQARISPIVFSRIIYDILDHKFENEVSGISVKKTEQIIDEKIRVKGGENVIVYGVPGAGKSHLVQNEYLKGVREDDDYERLVFHPDYTYSDFVGQIMPVINSDKSISYEFTPGPFTRILRKAYNNPTHKCFLVIEEVNRGNAPAIFGDIFQLLDRDSNGKSSYSITNKDIAIQIYKDDESNPEEIKNYKVYIPSNLTLICTMNTSDQNVYTLDTAFQRRWKMRLVPNSFEEDNSGIGKTKILDSDLTWEDFCNEINSIILDKSETLPSSEDKRLGAHFVLKSDLIYDHNFNSSDNDLKQKAIRQNHLFAEKVLKYLWDDAFKYDRGTIFNTTYKSLEKIIKDFVESEKMERFKIFTEDIKKDLEKITNSHSDSKNEN